MRDKWNEKRGSTTYGEQTITKALSYVCEYYNPRTPGNMRVRFRNWWALRIKGYGESPFRVLMYLAAHADENGVCFPSRKTGAKELGIHVDSWDDAIYTLKAFGILRKSRDIIVQFCIPCVMLVPQGSQLNSLTAKSP